MLLIRLKSTSATSIATATSIAYTSSKLRLRFLIPRRFNSNNVAKPSASASWSLKLPPVSSKEILKELWPLIWPKGDWRSRAKVGGAVSLLLGGKVNGALTSLNIHLNCFILGFKCSSSHSFQTNCR